MFKIALIGCGAIGSTVVEAILNEELTNVRLVGILDLLSNDVIERAQQVLGTHFVRSVEELIELGPDLVFEAAGHGAVFAYGRSVLAAGIDFLPMSVGALARSDFLTELTELANQQGATILISSGAIGALDMLRASRARGELEEVVLTSTKRPKALMGQPYLVEHGIHLDGLEEPLTVFDGPAAEACVAFPKSTNIAASVSLAGIGFDRTRVRVVADPKTPRTIHTLQARGAFGELQLTLQNYPHPENPSTSYLACLGPVAAFTNMQGAIRFV